MGYALQRYDSVRDVPKDAWLTSRRSASDIWMEPDFISVIEDTMPGRFWTFLVRDDRAQTAGIASACLFPVDGALLCPPRPRRVLRALRHVWPGCLRFSILFCGLPFSAGQSHLRIAPDADAQRVLCELDHGLAQLAREVSSSTIVWKEFTEEDLPQTDYLGELGYVRGPSLPMNHFPAAFHNFDEFCDALRSHYRYKIHRSQKKFVQAEFRVAHFCGAEAVPHYSDEVHRLYLATAEQAEVQLERIPAEFFRQWAARCGDAVRLTAVFQGERIVAIAWGVMVGDVYQNVFVGMDYGLNRQYDLYFNLMACDLDHALRLGARDIQMGQTADAFKSRLGCDSRPRYVYAKGTRWFTTWPLRLAHTLVFPPPPPPPARDLFR